MAESRVGGILAMLLAAFGLGCVVLGAALCYMPFLGSLLFCPLCIIGGIILLAVGDGGDILHRQNGNWEKIPSYTTEPLYDIHIAAPEKIWFCGASTLIQWDGRASR